MIDEKILGEPAHFLKDNTLVSAMVFTNEDDEEQIIGVKLPVKMEFTIKDAPPAIKGSTATGGNKVAVLENGATVNVPMFLTIGDKIIVNTETGEYVERA